MPPLLKVFCVIKLTVIGTEAYSILALDFRICSSPKLSPTTLCTPFSFNSFLYTVNATNVSLAISSA